MIKRSISSFFGEEAAGGVAVDEGMEEVNAKETETTDEGNKHGKKRGDHGEGKDMKRSGAEDLVAQSVEEEVSERKEKSEEDGVG